MARSNHLTRQDVVSMPETLKDGILYVSERYWLAIHNCACGCGIETITPLGADKNGWTLDYHLTMRPSIGNQQFPCRSHYFITEGRIEWL